MNITPNEPYVSLFLTHNLNGWTIYPNLHSWDSIPRLGKLALVVMVDNSLLVLAVVVAKQDVFVVVADFHLEDGDSYSFQF